MSAITGGQGLQEQYFPSRRQEWALINEHKALQIQKIKRFEQMMEQQKKKKFKHDLDQQMRFRVSKDQIYKEEDRKYAQQIVKKAEQQKIKEELIKRQKWQQRKNIEQHNRHFFTDLLDNKLRQKIPDKPQYNLDIGYSSEQIRNRIREEKKKQMIDELDRQIKSKEMQKYESSRNELLKDKQNLSIQLDQFSNRKNHASNRYYGQNPYVYQQYQNIVNQEERKKRQFEKRQIYEAGEKKKSEQKRKLEEKDRMNKQMNYQMKQMLDYQINIKEHQKQNYQRINPQDYSYRLLDKMFVPKRQNDKKEYSDYLRKQIEQKNRKREQQKYMSEQQYRININQLSRAVKGPYAKQSYIDRSIGSLGDANRKINVALIDAHLDGKQSDIVLKKLEDVKGKRERSFRKTRQFDEI